MRDGFARLIDVVPGCVSDACCPECGHGVTRFIPATANTGPRLKCCECGCVGRVVDFVGHEKWKYIVRISGGVR